MDEQTVKCTRPDCDTEIPLIRDNLVVLRPEVPLLSAKCPECGKTRVLTKDISKELVELYFKGDIEEMMEFDDMGCDGPLMPSKDLSKLVEETLDLLGYSGKKWKSKVKAITEFVKSGSTYQTPQGLHQLLAAWKIDSQHIPMIVQKVFGTIEGSQMPQYNFSQTAGYQAPNYIGAPFGQPTPIGSGYGMAQTPQGQIVVIPPPTPPASLSSKKDDEDMIIIEEKVGTSGKVTSRVIKQKPQKPPEPAEQKSGLSEFGAMVTMLKEMGVIGNESPPEPLPPVVSPEITATLEKIGNVLNALSAAQSPAYTERPESVASQQYKDELKGLNDEIKKMRDDQHKDEITSLRNEISAMRNSISNAPATGLNDAQFEISSKQQNLQTITQAIESTGSKLVEPMIQMQTMQSKLQGMMAVRQLEISDNVVPGTYMRAITPTEEVSDAEVSDTLQTWRDRVKKGDGDDK